MEEKTGCVAGACAWSPLSWDSRQFGISAARLEFLLAREDCIRRTILKTSLEGSHEAGIRHLTARVDSADLSGAHALEEAGFEVIDGILTFGMRLDGRMAGAEVSGPVEVGLYKKDQLEGIVKLASKAYQFDRFHADSALRPGVADRIHAEWLRNSCEGGAADVVITATRDKEVLGFVTVKADYEIERLCGVRLATIVLVATAEAARGMGIGTAMTNFTLRWLADRQVRGVRVGTQLRNIAACRLYESCGFRLIGSGLTFRKLL
ncbi:MAG: GNAT family N-acetyltransferase [Bryobacterales bacterium]|nr:GNAT family N-acetyltransferase [Bryobacterales bacterium]